LFQRRQLKQYVGVGPPRNAVLVGSCTQVVKLYPIDDVY